MNDSKSSDAVFLHLAELAELKNNYKSLHTHEPPPLGETYRDSQCHVLNAQPPLFTEVATQSGCILLPQKQSIFPYIDENSQKNNLHHLPFVRPELSAGSQQ